MSKLEQIEEQGCLSSTKMSKVARTALLTAGLCVVLDSCWFNGAGRIAREGSHQAKVYASDAQIGSVVYTDGYRYYVKLNHIFDDKEPKLIAKAGENNSTQECYSMGPQWYSVNPEFAQYITGHRSEPGYIKWVKAVSSSEAMNCPRSYTIVRSLNQLHSYHHSSPYIGWYNLGAMFEFLCVDVPVSLTLNTLAVVGFIFVAGGKGGPKPSTSSGSSSSDYDYERCSVCNDPDDLFKQRPGRVPSPSGGWMDCPFCGGRGWK